MGQQQQQQQQQQPQQQQQQQPKPDLIGGGDDGGASEKGAATAQQTSDTITGADSGSDAHGTPRLQGSGSEVFSAGTASIDSQQQQQQPKDAEEEEGIATINSNKPSPRMTSRSRLGGLTSSSGIRNHHPQTGDNSMNQQQQQELSLQHQGDDEGSTASTIGPSGAVTVAFENNEDMRGVDKRDRSFSQQSQNSELADADKNIEMDKLPQSGSKDNDQSLEKNHVLS